MDEDVGKFKDPIIPSTSVSQQDAKDFIVCSKTENGSDIASLKSLDDKSDISLDYGMLGRLNKSGHSSLSSFSEVQALDMEPTLGSSEHEHDVSVLMAEAQQDAFLPSQSSSELPLVKQQSASSTIEVSDQSWYSSVRKYSEYEDIDSSEAAVEFGEESDESGSNSPDIDAENFTSEGNDKEACVLFHGITYLGSAGVNAPVSEIELKRTISIMRDHAAVSFEVILAVGLTANSAIRLIDPTSRCDIATYDTKKIIFWGKADDSGKEKDCLAFNVSHGDEPLYHCHVFKCAEEDTVS